MWDEKGAFRRSHSQHFEGLLSIQSCAQKSHGLTLSVKLSRKLPYRLRELNPASTDEITSDSHLPKLRETLLFSLALDVQASIVRDSHDGPSCATSKRLVVIARAGGRRCERNLEHAPGDPRREGRMDQVFFSARSETGRAGNPIASFHVGGHTHLKSTTKALPDVFGLLEAAIMAATTSSIVGSGIPASKSDAAVPKMLVLTNCERFTERVRLGKTPRELLSKIESSRRG